jgi:hypothetical protein
MAVTLMQARWERLALAAAQQAAVYFRRAWECDPAFLMAGLNLAEALACFGQRTEAIDPAGPPWAPPSPGGAGTPRLRHQLALVYRAQGRAAEAEALWRQVLEVQPHFEPARQALADRVPFRPGKA